MIRKYENLRPKTNLKSEILNLKFSPASKQFAMNLRNPLNIDLRLAIVT